MRNFIFTIIFSFLLAAPALAFSVNGAALQQYTFNTTLRQRYNQQNVQRPMPYWQAQANYSTRNRAYSSYSNYLNSTTRR